MSQAEMFFGAEQSWDRALFSKMERGTKIDNYVPSRNVGIKFHVFFLILSNFLLNYLIRRAHSKLQCWTE